MSNQWNRAEHGKNDCASDGTAGRVVRRDDERADSQRRDTGPDDAEDEQSQKPRDGDEEPDPGRTDQDEDERNDDTGDDSARETDSRLRAKFVDAFPRELGGDTDY